MNASPRYNLTELLACVAASLLENGCSAFVGTGFPIVALALLAAAAAPAAEKTLENTAHALVAALSASDPGECAEEIVEVLHGNVRSAAGAPGVNPLTRRSRAPSTRAGTRSAARITVSILPPRRARTARSWRPRHPCRTRAASSAPAAS
jgi:hypothetical protein